MSEELPVAPLVQARLLTPFNTTYWTNFPTAENPYIHPGHWWVTGNYIIHGVTAGRAIAKRRWHRRTAGEGRSDTGPLFPPTRFLR